jgi:hypothetical protein
VRFGEQRDVRGCASRSGPRERELIGEDGFPIARLTEHELDTAREQSTAQDGVQALNARGNSFELRPFGFVFAHVLHPLDAVHREQIAVLVKSKKKPRVR